MRFSEHFGVDPPGKEEWFDPLLTEDTQLFVDPFLIFSESDATWVTAHGKLIDFFNEVMKLLAQSGFRPGVRYTKAEHLLLFPEPQEFCLGYSLGSTAGAGSSVGLRAEMLEGARAAIVRGIESVDHFEELAIFGGGIGADRISDVVCNVLKADFIAYTQKVCGELGIPMESVPVRHAAWSSDHLRWEDAPVELPINPFSGKGAILVPRRFLKRLPTVEQGDFWGWAWEYENEKVRNDFNYEIGRNADAEEITRFARRHVALVGEYLQWREQTGSTPYDIEQDPYLEVKWYEHGQALAASIQEEAKDPADFHALVRRMIDAFKHWVEEEGGWRVLWNDETNRLVPESKIQAVFRGIVVNYCRAYDIDLTGESNAGRGPVDFKFSKGWTGRALVEVKKMNNPGYKHGLEVQLPVYMDSEGVFVGYFVAVAGTDAEMDSSRLKTLKELAKDASEGENEVEIVVVDARPKKSASKADRKEDGEDEA